MSLNFFLNPNKNRKRTDRPVVKKQPPPRPPPPKLQDLARLRSKSDYNLSQQTIDTNSNLIQLSPPNSPVVQRNNKYGGSVSSSYSSSTGSLASSKKSFEYDSLSSNWYVGNNQVQTQNTNAQWETFDWPVESNTRGNKVNNQFSNLNWNVPTTTENNVQASRNIPTPTPSASSSGNGPTIIRAAPPKKIYFNRPCIDSGYQTQVSSQNSSPLSYCLPMPKVPPPSPPKEIVEVNTPNGLVMFDYPGLEPGDLPLRVNDVVILLRQINDEWFYGQIEDKEGMFPANCIEVVIPLPDDSKKTPNNIVTALYEFPSQMPEDLGLTPGQKVKVIHKINQEWLYGESNGKQGQFPAIFVDKIPPHL